MPVPTKAAKPTAAASRPNRSEGGGEPRLGATAAAVGNAGAPAAWPDASPPLEVVRPCAGGVLARRLMCLALATQLVAAWLLHYWRRLDMHPAESSLLVSSIAMLAVLVIWTAWSFSRADTRQRQAVAELGQSMQRLSASEERYRMLMEHANDAIVLLSASDQIVEVNRAGERLFGRSREQLLGQPYRTFVAREQRQESDANLMTILAGGSVRVENRQLLRPDGTRVAVEVSASMVRLGKDATAVTLLRDVTERSRAQAALRASEEQYRLLFEGNPHPMWVYDEETLAFLAVNESAVRHYGYSRTEFLAMAIGDLQAPGEATPTAERSAPNRRPGDPLACLAPRVWSHRKRDGAVIQVEVSGSSIDFESRRAWLVLANDISERQRLEARFLQAQKMESVGQLAGGVAHDFNNLLGVIVGYGELLSRRLPEDPRLRKYVSDILEAAERATGLTRQLLAFSRRQVLQPRILDLNRVVADIAVMLRRMIGEDIELATCLPEPLGRVRADPGQIEQILMNLAVNARDAMPRGGKLTVETANVLLDSEYTSRHPDVPKGPYVCLTVTDTGTGMAAGLQARIFEPFFTTKEAGKGTGLGLATVHGIVTQSGGHVVVDSEPERGASFKVYLPLWQDAADAEPVVLASGLVARGKETVLVVEDEVSLRRLVRESLEENGYRVLSAGTGAEALAFDVALAIDLLITDVVMPDMGGRELAERLVAMRPELRLLYMSGYTDDAVVRHGILSEEVAFLSKPFTVDALAAKVRAVLDA